MALAIQYPSGDINDLVPLIQASAPVFILAESILAFVSAWAQPFWAYPQRAYTSKHTWT
jgi:hypothetical protein